MPLKILQPGLRPLGQFDLEDDDTIFGGELLELTKGNSTDRAASDANVDSRLLSNSQVYINTAAAGSDFANTQLGEQGSGPFDENNAQLNLSKFAGALDNPSFVALADDGQIEYGTLFGTAIGGTAGQGTQVGASYGTNKGTATTLGPRSYFGSGKVTAWTQPGLYGICGGHSVDANGSYLFADSQDTTGSSLAETYPGAMAVNTLIGPAANAANPRSSADTTAGSSESGKWSAFKDAGDQSGTNAVAHDIDTGAALMIGKIYDSSLVSTTALAAGGSAEIETYAVYFLGIRQGT